MRHIVAAKFETIRNILDLRIELNKVAFPAKAGIKKAEKPNKKTIGAVPEKIAASQIG